MKKTTLITVLLVSLLLFVMGARGRYGPFIWQTVAGGIQYIGGNVNITNGTLTTEGGQILSDDATITQSADNYITLTENSDTLQVYFDGSNVELIYSDGALVVRNAEDSTDGYFNIAGKNAGEKGILQILSDGDDKAVQAYHDDTDGQITTSSGDLYITANGGDINLNDDNLTTTGTAEAATITEGGVAVISVDEPVCYENAIVCYENEIVTY